MPAEVNRTCEFREPLSSEKPQTLDNLLASAEPAAPNEDELHGNLNSRLESGPHAKVRSR